LKELATPCLLQCVENYSEIQSFSNLSQNFLGTLLTQTDQKVALSHSLSHKATEQPLKMIQFHQIQRLIPIVQLPSESKYLQSLSAIFLPSGDRNIPNFHHDRHTQKKVGNSLLRHLVQLEKRMVQNYPLYQDGPKKSPMEKPQIPEA
jgi:hypothetical protein